jgi:hypothetical protein
VPATAGGRRAPTSRLPVAVRNRVHRRTGALPLELTVALPTAGGYAIEAREARASAAGAGGAFRGNYRLRVESDAGENRGEALLLEPTGQTEP